MTPELARRLARPPPGAGGWQAAGARRRLRPSPDETGGSNRGRTTARRHRPLTRYGTL